jgi:hypothetical protein
MQVSGNPSKADPPLVNQGLDKHGNPTNGKSEGLIQDKKEDKSNVNKLNDDKAKNAKSPDQVKQSACCVIF